jgi:hypothetical protein
MPAYIGILSETIVNGDLLRGRITFSVILFPSVILTLHINLRVTLCR